MHLHFSLRFIFEVRREPHLNLRMVKRILEFFGATMLNYSLCYKKLFSLKRKPDSKLNQRYSPIFFRSILLYKRWTIIIIIDYYVCIVFNFWDALHQKQLKNLKEKGAAISLTYLEWILSSFNLSKLVVWNKRDNWSWSDWIRIWTHNLSVCKRKLNHLAKPVISG